MKLSILGGGGFRTPFVWQAVLRNGGAPRIDHVTLYDVDARRLEVMSTLLAQQAKGFPHAPRLTVSTSLDDAVAGSDFVFAAIRVGGIAGRQCDEHVPLDLSVLGQETTGPGGIAYALRTVPVMMRVAESVARVAPRAFVINFTNPAGIVTEAMQSILGDRVVGICDTPSGLGRRIARLLHVDEQRIQMDYVGLNHLGWMRALRYDGRDILPDLLADDHLLMQLEEGEIFGADLIRAIRAVPNEYLYYYYYNRDAVRAIKDSHVTRGDFLARTQNAFWDTVGRASDKVAAWQDAVSQREASYMAEATGGTQDAPTHPHEHDDDPAKQGYAGVAIAVMNAIARNERATAILNVRNGGVIAALPADAVVEVPAMVDANGAHPFATAQPTMHQLGLMAQVKEVERRAIAAATGHSREQALYAFALHPLVDSVSVAREILDGYLAKSHDLAAVLTA